MQQGGPRRTEMRRRLSRGLLGSVVLTVAALGPACTVGPSYRRPKAEAPPAFKEPPPAGWKEAQPRDEIAKGDWWVVFGDPVLNYL